MWPRFSGVWLPIITPFVDGEIEPNPTAARAVPAAARR
jgi:hypothetical protein